MYWIDFEQPTGKSFPKQLLTLGISRNDRTVFLPALLAGTEQDVIRCARYRPTVVAMIDGHPYMSATWMAEEFPEIRDRCDFLVDVVRRESERLRLFDQD
ncbi:hypothetical protein [Stenotrophomonas geniculata]|uniref:hypothetical protein n=1 Tax=Stenotrophomonas geniculata TaxID=86188 RepID=UPI0011DFBE79|nr:hypothetical protein [Stenotrophomonas geniculata]